jgi:hypothetical protein
MLRENTNAGILGQLVRFSAALAANSSELAHLEGMRVRFEKLVSEAQAIAQQQAALVASKQEASKRLQSLLTEGVRSATGLERLLAEFGLQPFRGRTRRSKEQPETPEPSPPEEKSASEATEEAQD